MLILSRKKDESILIGSDIEVTVIAVQGDQVKLGIKAPKKVDVYRRELFEEIQNENDPFVGTVVGNDLFCRDLCR